MQVSIFMVSSVLVFIVYSALKYFQRKGILQMNAYEASLLKLLSILCLLEKDATSWIYNVTLLMYAIGDVVIMWNQSFSLIFFQVGHLFFLSTYFQQNVYYEFLLPFFAVLTFSIHYFLIYRNPKICDKPYEYILYWMYIFVSQCFLIVPVLHGYFGTIPFLISDLSIGFQLDIVHTFEYPLYYLSLLYLRWSHMM